MNFFLWHNEAAENSWPNIPLILCFSCAYKRWKLMLWDMGRWCTITHDISNEEKNGLLRNYGFIKSEELYSGVLKECVSLPSYLQWFLIYTVIQSYFHTNEQKKFSRFRLSRWEKCDEIMIKLSKSTKIEKIPWVTIKISFRSFISFWNHRRGGWFRIQSWQVRRGLEIRSKGRHLWGARK